MATTNPFDLLGDDAEDPSQLIVAEQLKAAAAPPAAKKGAVKEQGKPNKPALLPSKPTPPAQAVRESRNEGGRGGRGFGGRGGDRDRGFGGRGGDRGFGGGRGGRGFGRDYSNDDNSLPASGAPENQGPVEEGDRNSERRSYGGPRGPYRGGRRGGFNNGDAGEEGRPRRTFERHSGTGRGNDFKREGAGRGNWGTETDEISQVTEEVMNEGEKNLGDEKPAAETDVAEVNKDSPANEAEEKEPEDKEMTLEEYEKVLEEKRKALQTLKTEERKVDTKAFETMQALSCKKDNTEIFAKLGADKDKRKEAYDKEEKAKKSVSINEFLKPAEGESHYNSGGRGRGRGGRGARGGGFRGNSYSNVPAPSIEDPGHFPTLGAK